MIWLVFNSTDERMNLAFYALPFLFEGRKTNKGGAQETLDLFIDFQKVSSILYQDFRWTLLSICVKLDNKLVYNVSKADDKKHFVANPQLSQPGLKWYLPLLEPENVHLSLNIFNICLRHTFSVCLCTDHTWWLEFVFVNKLLLCATLICRSPCFFPWKYAW